MTTRNLGTEGFSWFFGVVEDRNDPLKLGRVRVRVHNFHEDDELIPTNTLHWSSIIMPPTSASFNGLGTSPTGIAVGTTVFGFFVDGAEKQKPVVLGTMHGIPESDKHDVVIYARGENGIAKGKVGPEPESAYAAVYPYNKTITTESGHAIELDDTPGHERMHVYHKSGTYIEINNVGQRATTIVDDDIEVVLKDKKIHVQGNCELFIGKDAKVNIAGDADITVYGNSKSSVVGTSEHQSTGKMTIESSSDINILSSSKIVMKAPRIDLNPKDGPEVEIDIAELEAQANEQAVVQQLGRAAIIDDVLDVPEYSSVLQPYEATTETPTVGSLEPSPTLDSTQPSPEVTPPEAYSECSAVTTPDYSYSLSSRFTLGMLSKRALYSHELQAQAGLGIGEIVCNLQQLAVNILEPLAAQYPGFRINSGFRRSKNPSSTSGKISQHEKGQAIDIQWPGITPQEYKTRAQWCRDNLPYDQLIFEHGNSVWIHLSFNRSVSKQRKQVLTMYREQYTPGITLYYA